MHFFKKLTHRPFFIRLFNWEYWSFNALYGPIYIYWVWLFVKARSFFFFNTANPTIKNGGFLMESKKEIYDLIPPQYYPATLYFDTSTMAGNILQQVQQKGIRFPAIAKPDIGMRGLGVQKLDTPQQLLQYAHTSKVPFLVQDYVPYVQEAGIFYYRYPGEKTGYISGIVGKELLTVTGDGTSTIEALIKRNKRFILQLPVLTETLGSKALQKVLADKEQQLLIPYGNHARGAKFTDDSHLIDEQLVKVIDDFCRQVPGFYFGRLDIRYESWEALREGRNFSVIELNGAGSEPTHMYDPKHSVFFAWKEIIRHWNILWKISKLNHTVQQLPYMSFASGMQMFKENKRYVQLLTEQSVTVY